MAIPINEGPDHDTDIYKFGWLGEMLWNSLIMSVLGEHEHIFIFSLIGEYKQLKKWKQALFNHFSIATEGHNLQSWHNIAT